MTKSHISRSTFLRFNHFIKTRAIYLFLLPVFFVLHGYSANYEAINGADVFFLALFYVGVSLVVAMVAWLFYRDAMKAALFAFGVMCYHFFFGVIQDFLTDKWPGSFISQYRFLLSASCLLLVVSIISLKKRRKTLFTITSYLNVLLLVLVLIDTAGLFFRIAKPAAATSLKEAFSVCDTCKKPDVYFILLDQYAGNTALKDVFHFDNVAFESELNRRGFHVAKNSSSNYNLTPFSMASTLNMSYLGPEMGYIKHLNVTYSYNVIRESLALDVFKAHGYEFSNLSVFDFPGRPAHKYGAFLPYGTELITGQTFISRVKKTVRADILSGKIKLRSVQEKLAYEHLHFNDDILEMTKEVAARKMAAPKFVYSHLIMPHWPYYYDSKGQSVPIEKLQGFRETNAHDYIEYLQYTNGKILQLVDYLLSASSSPPVIILLGDHGFRNPEKKTEHKYDFYNLNAICLPGKNYAQFSDDMTNVNFFRVFFNSCFNQHFSLLKDTTINLWE